MVQCLDQLWKHKMKLITFDGQLGSGKTTQMKILAEVLGKSCLNCDEGKPHQFSGFITSGDFKNRIFSCNVKSLLIANMIYQIKQSDTEIEYVLISHFWYSFFHLSKSIQIIDKALIIENQKHMDFIIRDTEIVGFYIKTSAETHVKRQILRFAEQLGVKNDISNISIEIPEPIVESAEHENNIYEIIEKTIPSFHILDGEQTQEQIHEKIKSIVTEKESQCVS